MLCESCRFLSQQTFRTGGGAVEAVCLKEDGPHRGAFRSTEDCCPAFEPGPAVDDEPPEQAKAACIRCGYRHARDEMIETADSRSICLSCHAALTAEAAACAHCFEPRPPYGMVCDNCGLVREDAAPW